jgi:ribosomal protection tetracycline resistance protein
MVIVNLEIKARVDAGKSSLSERILVETGVIDAAERVADGGAPTDALAVERQRGATIAPAVVSVGSGEATVNLIGTPGHPDVIAGAERVLGVLDGKEYPRRVERHAR